MKPIQFVFIRGLTRESAHWEEEFINLVLKQHPGSSAVALDYPGTGVYYKASAPMSIRGNVEHMRRDYLQLKKDKNVTTILVSISMGGMISVEWANLYPQDLSGIILINTSLGSMSPFFHRLRPANYPFILFNKVLANTLAKKEGGQLKIVSNRADKHGPILQKWVEIQRKRPMTTINAAKQLFSAGTYRPHKNAPKVPILLLVGLGDRLVNPKCSEVIHQHWNSAIERHPTGGHELTIDEPNWCAEKIGEWIKKEGH